MRSWTALTALCLLTSCGGVDRDVEDRLTLTQGVYGQTTYYNDTWPASHRFQSYPLDVHAVPRDGMQPLAQTTSDERGFYEVAVPPGDYEICVNVENCHGFSVAPDQVVRIDYQSFEPGWWDGRIPD